MVLISNTFCLAANKASRNFNTPKLLASSNTKASRFSFTSVTKAPLKEPTDEVMNTTMDEDSLGTLLMDDPGDGEDNPRLWWTGADHTTNTFLSTGITNAFNRITQATIPETMTSQCGG